jgi:hypothetical protein
MMPGQGVDALPLNSENRKLLPLLRSGIFNRKIP